MPGEDKHWLHRISEPHLRPGCLVTRGGIPLMLCGYADECCILTVTTHHDRLLPSEKSTQFSLPGRSLGQHFREHRKTSTRARHHGAAEASPLRAGQDSAHMVGPQWPDLGAHRLHLSPRRLYFIAHSGLACAARCLRRVAHRGSCRKHDCVPDSRSRRGQPAP